MSEHHNHSFGDIDLHVLSQAELMQEVKLPLKGMGWLQVKLFHQHTATS